MPTREEKVARLKEVQRLKKEKRLEEIKYRKEKLSKEIKREAFLDYRRAKLAPSIQAGKEFGKDVSRVLDYVPGLTRQAIAPLLEEKEGYRIDELTKSELEDALKLKRDFPESESFWVNLVADPQAAVSIIGGLKKIGVKIASGLEKRYASLFAKKALKNTKPGERVAKIESISKSLKAKGISGDAVESATKIAGGRAEESEKIVNKLRLASEKAPAAASVNVGQERLSILQDIIDRMKSGALSETQARSLITKVDDVYKNHHIVDLETANNLRKNMSGLISESAREAGSKEAKQAYNHVKFASEKRMSQNIESGVEKALGPEGLSEYKQIKKEYGNLVSIEPEANRLSVKSLEAKPFFQGGPVRLAGYGLGGLAAGFASEEGGFSPKNALYGLLGTAALGKISRYGADPKFLSETGPRVIAPIAGGLGGLSLYEGLKYGSKKLTEDKKEEKK